MSGEVEMPPLRGTSSSGEQLQLTAQQRVQEVEQGQVPPATTAVSRGNVAVHVNDSWVGIALAVAVTFLWGINPALTRILFLTANPPEPAVIAVIQLTLAAILCEMARRAGHFIRKVREHVAQEEARQGEDATILPGQDAQRQPSPVVASQPGSPAGPVPAAASSGFRSWKHIGKVPIPVPSKVSPISHPACHPPRSKQS
jgi:hypothetical protein